MGVRQIAPGLLTLWRPCVGRREIAPVLLMRTCGPVRADRRMSHFGAKMSSHRGCPGAKVTTKSANLAGGATVEVVPRVEWDSLGADIGCAEPLGGCIRATGVSHNKRNHGCVSSGSGINGHFDIPLKRPAKNTRPEENVLTKHFMCVGIEEGINKSILYYIYKDNPK